jgi:hypothetical protein
LPIPTETEPRRHVCSECRSERYGIRSQSIPHGVLMSLHRRIGRTWHKRGFINPRVDPIPSLSAHGPGCAQGDDYQIERRRGAASANSASAMAASRRAPTWHISERSNPARRAKPGNRLPSASKGTLATRPRNRREPVEGRGGTVSAFPGMRAWTKAAGRSPRIFVTRNAHDEMKRPPRLPAAPVYDGVAVAPVHLVY